MIHVIDTEVNKVFRLVKLDPELITATNPYDAVIHNEEYGYCSQSSERLVAVSNGPVNNFIQLDGVIQAAPIITQNPNRAVFVLACSLVYKEGKNIVRETIHYPVICTQEQHISLCYQMEKGMNCRITGRISVTEGAKDIIVQSITIKP